MAKLQIKIEVGRTYTNKKGWRFVVTALDVRKTRSNSYHLVEFPATGFTTQATSAEIRRGLVIDRMSKGTNRPSEAGQYVRKDRSQIPTVCGVGYSGEMDSRKEHPKEYRLWTDMIHRCYGDKPSGANVYWVWHNFAKFLRDIQKLEGYAEWKSGTPLQLDKDKKSKDGIYAPWSCSFITAEENSKIGKTASHCFR